MNGSSRGLSILNDIHPPRLHELSSSRTSHAPLPHELENIHTSDIDRTLLNKNDRTKTGSFSSASIETLASRAHDRHQRELKKPHLAISELVDSTINGEPGDHSQIQLPSFVSLSVVEKSPTPGHVNLGLSHEHGYPHKRLRLDASSDQLSLAHDMNRTLPRPFQKDDKQVIPLLPAMVTGLHEPPPSADLLPSMSDARPPLQRSATTTSKMQVKDMLSSERASISRPPEQMLNTPEVSPAELPRLVETGTQSPEAKTPTPPPSLQAPKKDSKVRRARRKWSDAETRDLLAGVEKHGFGKWKQILIDPTYSFDERTSIDLKDRYRVFAKDLPEKSVEPVNSDDAQPDSADVSVEGSETKASAPSKTSSKRRKRHPWTREEDNALLQGVNKHGFQWTEIHNDTELGLNHRRATDLRDRIRNLYPNDYKHAEARPLRAEMKKAEKAGKKETPAGTLYAPPAQMDAINFPNSTGPGSSSPSPRRRQTTSGKVPSIATLTQPQEDLDLSVTARPTPRRSKTLAEITETSGITLPSLALDSNNIDEDWDNTLPPFMNWEHEI